MGNFNRTRRVALAVLVLACSWPVQAEALWAALVWQNDFFVGHDGGGYTNGLFIARFREPGAGQRGVEAPVLVRPLFGVMGLAEGTAEVSRATHTLGQVMITPKLAVAASSDSSAPLDKADVPYAGLLYWRSAYVQVQGDQAEVVAATLGVVGPASGAAQLQRFVHRVTDSDTPRGWGSQVRNAPVFSVERHRIWRHALDGGGSRGGGGGGRQTDLVLRVGGAIGNLESSLGAGLLLRYGVGLERSFSNVAYSTSRRADPLATAGGWYVFVGLGGDLVFNDIVIDGRRIDAARAGGLRHAQTTWISGVACGWNELTLSLSLQSMSSIVQRSRERQSFGSLTLAWRL